MRERTGGFTLVELLVVLIIVGVLLSVAIGRYWVAVSNARQTSRLAFLRTLTELTEARIPRLEDSQWILYVRSELGEIPPCPYSGEPYELLTGTISTTDETNICRVAYHRTDDVRYVITSYHFISGFYDAKAVRIAELHYQSGCSSEYVLLENYGAVPVNLSGWTISDTLGSIRYTFTFSSYILEPYSTVKVPSRPKVQSFGSWSHGCVGGIWNDTGDKAVLMDSRGNIVDEKGY